MHTFTNRPFLLIQWSCTVKFLLPTEPVVVISTPLQQMRSNNVYAFSTLHWITGKDRCGPQATSDHAINRNSGSGAMNEEWVSGKMVLHWQSPLLNHASTRWDFFALPIRMVSSIITSPERNTFREISSNFGQP
jgi:hypothetical protein